MHTFDLDPVTLVTLVCSQLRGSWSFETASNPFVGGEYNVYMLVDKAQRQRISVRIPRAPPGNITSLRLELEAGLHQQIDDAQLPRFQPLLACDPTADNIIRRPFMILGWADGSPLTWLENVLECESRRKGVLKAIANTTLDLLQINQRGMDALNWIRAKIDCKIAQATANSFLHGTVSECEKQKSLISRYWMPEIDNAPHVLVHGDLSSNNIIVDDEFEVKGVIDLGWAEMVPLQYAAAYLRFLTFEPVETDTGVSWTDWNFAQQDKDCQYYLTCVKERAEHKGGLALLYYLVLSQADELNRFWWYTAASRADIHRAMAKCDWDPASAIYREHGSLDKPHDNLLGL